MERHELMAMMAELSLAGMRAAYDEVISDGPKRQRTVQQILGDLLAAERTERQARSIRYKLGAAKLLVAKTLAEFDFTASPLNEGLVRDLNDDGFLETQRNAVFIGGTGTGKMHVCIAITGNCVPHLHQAIDSDDHLSAGTLLSAPVPGMVQEPMGP